jgi:hypothetical protein
MTNAEADALVNIIGKADKLLQETLIISPETSWRLIAKYCIAKRTIAKMRKKEVIE